MAEPHDDARAIVLAALSCQTPLERAALVDGKCGQDADLRHRVLALLQDHEKPGEFLSATAAGRGESITAPVSLSSSAPSETGTMIAGRYKLLEKIGEGGMGSVWLADQREPVKRRVAVKLISAECGTSRLIVSRFEAERQAIALMDHPNIAKLLDAGTTDGGAPYFVMELVNGVPLTDYCDAHRLSIRERLALFHKICSAVQHAHQKGIIHRDLKPSNILVESRDGTAVPRVIDFGLAKTLSGQPLTEHTLFTGFGTVAGTPLYMAPEQASFNAIDVDTRADIYSLGVVLYELLTGSTPLERAAIRQAALDEVLRLIRENEPPRPSKRLSATETVPQVAAHRHTEPAKLGRLVRGELNWITMKALSKERDRRYETAAGFAREIERFLNHEPVLAGPPTARYKLRKFVKRNRAQVAAASFLATALLAGIMGTSFGFVRAEHRRQEAERARSAEARQRARAEAARDRTRQALDAMTSSVTGDSLTTQTEVSADQKRFLTEVLTYYREFAGERADDETSRARTAAAARRVGMIEGRLGRFDEAAAAFQLARDGYATLATDFAAAPGYRLELARNHKSLGDALADRGKSAESEREQHKALAIYERLAAEFPDVPEYRRELALGDNSLAILSRELGNTGRRRNSNFARFAVQKKPPTPAPCPRTAR